MRRTVMIVVMLAALACAACGGGGGGAPAQPDPGEQPVAAPPLATPAEVASLLEAEAADTKYDISDDQIEIECVSLDSEGRKFECLGRVPALPDLPYRSYYVVCDTMNCQWSTKSGAQPSP